MLKYSINLIWSEIDFCYVATIPEISGLSAFGEIPEEAIFELRIALTGFMKVYKEDNCLIPEPKTLESKNK